MPVWLAGGPILPPHQAAINPCHPAIGSAIIQGMNWYFAENGTSHGPHGEAEMARLFSRREIPADALVWHPGMSEWQGLDELNPEWAAAAADVLPLSGSIQQPAPQPAAAKDRDAESQPGAGQREAAAAVVASRSSEPPMPSRLRPLAPSPEAAGQGGKKPGLLRRLFGKGGSKS